jgi:uncharacterized membrane protein
MLAKAFSWRIVGSLDTFILSFLLLTFLAPLLGIAPSGHAHHARTAGYIAGTEFFTKILLYYLHELVWTRQRWNVRQRADGIDEGYGRNGAKAVTWRMVGFVDTVILSLIFTGSATMAVSIGGLELLTKITLYVIHERLWQRLRFGLERVDMPIGH